MISRTTLKSRIAKKTNPSVKQTIAAAMNEKAYISLAQVLSSSTRRHASVNLSDISKEAKEGIVVVPGKVLGSGNLDKKISVYALSFSSSAEEKLNKAKIAHGSISDLISKNPKATGIQVMA